MKLTYNCTIPNTFGLPVHAACLLEYDSAAELRALLVDGRFSAELPLPLLHIGSGSNLLFTGDFPGTVLHSRIGGIEEMPFHDEKQAVAEDPEIISLDLGEALEEYLDQAPTRMRG